MWWYLIRSNFILIQTEIPCASSTICIIAISKYFISRYIYGTSYLLHIWCYMRTLKLYFHHKSDRHVGTTNSWCKILLNFSSNCEKICILSVLIVIITCNLFLYFLEHVSTKKRILLLVHILLSFLLYHLHLIVMHNWFVKTFVKL